MQPSLAKTKGGLIEVVAIRTRLPIGRADIVVNRVFDCMAEALERGEGIEVRGFGSFSVRLYRGYLGRNPRSGDTVLVKAKRLPFFKAGKTLRERINAVSSGTSARTARKVDR
jgi:integration host factor subunit beta